MRRRWADGDLSRKITVDVKGEILELKNTINTVVDQLMPAHFVDATPTFPAAAPAGAIVRPLPTSIEMYAAAPRTCARKPCHSPSDRGPNGGRACPRRQVAQHLRRDNHTECDYGGEQNETRDNRRAEEGLDAASF
jgi:hypothetical protein